MTKANLAGVLCALAASITIGPSWADSAVARSDLELKTRPRAKARLIARVPKQAKLSVLRRKGRWVLVAYRKRRGWVSKAALASATPSPEPSSLSDSTAAPQEPDTEVQRSPSRRSSSRRSGATAWSAQHDRDAVEVEVIASRVNAYDDPRRRGRSVFQARAGDLLGVIGSSNSGWFLVENPQGKIGWIPKASTVDTVPQPTGQSSAQPADRSSTNSSRSIAKVKSRPQSVSSRDGLWLRGRIFGGMDSVGIRDDAAGRLTTAYSSSGGASLLLGYRMSSISFAVFGEALSSVRSTTAAHLSSSPDQEEQEILLRSGRAGAVAIIGGNRLRGSLTAGYAAYQLAPATEMATEPIGWRVGGWYAGVGGALSLTSTLDVRVGAESMFRGRRVPDLGADEAVEQKISGLGVISTTTEVTARATRYMHLNLSYRFGTFPRTAGVDRHLNHTITLGLGIER